MSQKVEIESIAGDLEASLHILDEYLDSRSCIMCPKIVNEILPVADALHSSQQAIDKLNQIQKNED